MDLDDIGPVPREQIRQQLLAVFDPGIEEDDLHAVFCVSDRRIERSRICNVMAGERPRPVIRVFQIPVGLSDRIMVEYAGVHTQGIGRKQHPRLHRLDDVVVDFRRLS